MNILDFWKKERDHVTSLSEVISLDSLNVGDKPKQVRPSWSDVYRGYPKKENGEDEDAETVFISILGKKLYEEHIDTFTNACATRVSLGLLAGGMKLPTYLMLE